MPNQSRIVAQFKNAHDLLHGADTFRKNGYTEFETYSPFPIHGMDSAMGLKRSKLPWLSLCGGLVGMVIGLSLQIWTSAVAYKTVVSGKELISIPAFMPVTFELTILLTAFATVFGMFALNKLPQLYHTVFNHSTFTAVTCDGFFLSVDESDKKFNNDEVRALLKELGGSHIERVHAEEGKS